MSVIRTTIELNENLLGEAMELLPDFRTKKDVVEFALHELVQRRRKKNLMDIKGTIEFADGYDYKAMREDDEGYKYKSFKSIEKEKVLTSQERNEEVKEQNEKEQGGRKRKENKNKGVAL